MNPGPMRAQAERLAWLLLLVAFALLTGASLVLWPASTVQP